MLIMTDRRQCRFLCEMAATSLLAAFSLLFKFKTLNRAAKETMTACLLISRVSLDSVIFTCNRKYL